MRNTVEKLIAMWRDADLARRHPDRDSRGYDRSYENRDIDQTRASEETKSAEDLAREILRKRDP